MSRISGLTINRDGTRLVTTMATLNSDKNKYVTSIWEVDPSGERPARRLTRSAKGESVAAFLPDGDLLFTSARPDPEADDDDEQPMLWLLPEAGGEARVVAKRPGGIGDVKVARDAGTIVVASSTFPSSTDTETEEAKRKQRKDAKVSAILHESYPVRFWDHDLGPDAPRLFAGTLADDGQVELHDLTPDAGIALVEAGYDVSADGTTVVASWNVGGPGGVRPTLVAIDVATKERRTLLDEENFEFFDPAISPDGTMVVALREALSTPTDPPDMSLVLVSLRDGTSRVLDADWDRWPSGATWTPDGAAVLVGADDDGRSPVFRVDVATGDVTRLTVDDAVFGDIVTSPEGNYVYALKSSYVTPPSPVRIATAGEPLPAVELPSPAPTPELPGTLEEVSATAQDGTRVRGWLVLPESATAESPAPLLLWVHGGPLSSWSAWSWRWNPWIMAAQGYAVLLPDPSLSTGYGREFISRGWGRWGREPYTDLMSITDTVEARNDIDASRTAMMGGSFGGYMANWIAGQTDRFDAIVTHASLWALEAFGGATDGAWYWEREMTTEMMAENSPHLHVDKITTPMLVIHGDKDYRVPISEGLRLWWDLLSRWKGDADAMPHKFLYFPDENHWILSPQHAKVWYETVLAFLRHQVLGQDWQAPDALR
jgi:dipeptidyl aminopeptidase/acylaminoacyl peptidase